MNLHEKIIEIMNAVQYVQKDGKVEFGVTKYKYASESKITAVIREQLIRQKVTILPFGEPDYRKNGNLTELVLKYKITNADDPEDYIIVPGQCREQLCNLPDHLRS